MARPWTFPPWRRRPPPRGPVLPEPDEGSPPGLARRLGARLGRLLLPPRQLRPTLEGLVFLVLVAAVAGAALNTGNNLLYLLCAMTLSLVAVSGVVSESAIRRLQVRRELPGEIRAGEAAQGRLVLSNPRRWLPNAALSVDERPGRRADGGAETVTVVNVPPGGQVIQRLAYTFRRRGQHRMSGFTVSTTFPFGLFRKSYRIEEPVDVLVYPRLGRRTAPTRGTSGGSGDRSGRGPGMDGDFRGLRDFEDGEDARRIHWKTSARRDRLVAVERSDGDREAVTVHLLPGDDPTGDGNPGFVDRFEDAVEDAAGVACQLLARGGEVGLVTPAGRLPAAAGPGQRTAILTHLALLPVPDAPLPGPLMALRAQLGGHDVVVA